ncbi:hypothetical protein [Epilithonimonas caeni]|uniref:hypothetical protein n=1 Tax=Epilithonimonas caeni TaxID=365343 RepID=UPI00048357F6|nr:hypothetical protein [Epilithonimonas caeni]
MIKLLQKRKLLQNLIDFFRKTKVFDLYDKCNILPIHNFNEAMSGDLSFLKKDPNSKVPDFILQNLWIEILDEFLKISDNKISMMMLGKKIKTVYLLSQMDVFTAIKVSINAGVDVEPYLKKYRVKKENIDLKISLLKNEINRIFFSENKKENNDGQGHSNFEMSLAMIRKEGYSVDRFKMVVTEWCAILNQIEKQHKIQQKNGKRS